MQILELKVKDVSDQQLHHYRFQARNHAKLSGRLFINEVEIHRFTPEHNQISSNQIHNWLIPGENTLTISIEDCASSEQDTFNPMYSCSLHGMPLINLPDDHNCLWKIEVLDIDSRPPLSLHYNFLFTSLQVPSSKLWKNAEQVEYLAQTEQEEILSLKNALVSAFETGDADKVIAIYDYVLNEEALMFNQKMTESLAKIREELSVLSNMAKQGCLRLEHGDNYYFNHLADNRVVQLCAESGGAAVIMYDDNGDAIELNIYASKIDGQWSLVRR